MLTKTKIALAAALVFGSASVALADGEFDPNLGNRYPAYNNPIAAPGAFQSAPVALHRDGRVLRTAPVALHRDRTLRTAPVRLNDQPTFGEPLSYGAGHLPRAFYDQEQAGYPQSPPGGGY
jgi:hypothetical protein